MTQRELEDPPRKRERPPATLLDRVRVAVVSSLWLGYAPVASGTFGTLGGVGVVLLLRDVVCPRFGWHFGLTAAVAALALTALGIALGGWAERYYRLKDPGPFVLDEVVGLLVTVLRVQGGAPQLRELVMAFIAFRIFDVIKPWPARRMEHLPKGFGIMLDDVVAALYALAVVTVMRWFLGPEKGWP